MNPIILTSLIPLVQEWGAEKGLHANAKSSADLQPQLTKLLEEMGEIAAGVARGNHEQIVDSVGDLLVVLIQFGAIHDKLLGLDRATTTTESYFEMCLNVAWIEISARKGKTVGGVFIKEEK